MMWTSTSPDSGNSPGYASQMLGAPGWFSANNDPATLMQVCIPTSRPVRPIAQLRAIPPITAAHSIPTVLLLRGSPVTLASMFRFIAAVRPGAPP